MVGLIIRYLQVGNRFREVKCLEVKGLTRSPLFLCYTVLSFSPMCKPLHRDTEHPTSNVCVHI
jgi:hypothetical protein